MKSPLQPLDADVPARSVRVHASLPQTERKSRMAGVVSFLVHALIIYLAIRLTATVALPEHSPIGDAIKLVLGGGGGGGGHGGPAFAHPPPPPPPPVAPPIKPPAPVPIPAVTPPPVVPQPVPPPAPAAAEPSAANAAPTAGTGAGTGGGNGTGEGPGTGSGKGPGSGSGSGGGNGAGGAPPISKQMILPPTDGVPKELHGKTIEVTFYVTALGLVSDVKIDPAIENRAFARKIDEIMRRYTFTPARDAAGNKIASIYPIQFTFGGK